jgi:hypothetical protein
MDILQAIDELLAEGPSYVETELFQEVKARIAENYGTSNVPALLASSAASCLEAYQEQIDEAVAALTKRIG